MKHSPLIVTLSCAVLLACALPRARAAEAASFPSIDVSIEQANGESVASAHTNGAGAATLKITKAGNYSVVVQPLSRARTGTYNRAVANTARIAISGALRPVMGSYNLTGTAPYRAEVNVGDNATLSVKITPPPPPPPKNEEARPVMS